MVREVDFSRFCLTLSLIQLSYVRPGRFPVPEKGFYQTMTCDLLFLDLPRDPEKVELKLTRTESHLVITRNEVRKVGGIIRRV